MGISFANNVDKSVKLAKVSPEVEAEAAAIAKITRTGIKTLVPTLDLDQPGLLRLGHLLHLYSCSQPAFYIKMKNGHVPLPDGRDPRPFWRTATIREHLLTGKMPAK